MKKISLIVVSIFLLFLAGCTESTTNQDLLASKHQQTEKTVQIKTNITEETFKSQAEEFKTEDVIEEKEGKIVSNNTKEEKAEQKKDSTKTLPVSSAEKETTSKSQSEKSTQTKKEADSPKETKQEEKAAPVPKPAERNNNVTISINGKGVILSNTTIEVTSNDTVLTILQRVTKAQGISLSVRGSGGMSYVEGINNLFEFDYGPQSGWIYKVNGTSQNKSAGIYKVNPGDVILWEYTE
ncbi:DUF4430 domain-containing protein [Bacillus sp. PS06]|uniref:DUF4430 domain-containing protein n=1 Tax=Bacillus sp. PS06 TaxID=2764176 RepID=UPI001CD852B4|nr:DUF4430 domain-containing protein [Bacillus sp. PS06]